MSKYIVLSPTQRLNNIIGKTFGRWTVIGLSDSRPAPCGKIQYYWTAQCICGRECRVTRATLVNQSKQKKVECSCILKVNGKPLKENAAYGPWKCMWLRCTRKKDKGYPRYGGRGITVCDRWKSFEAFLEDMGDRPSGQYSIERRNNDGNYEPSNCYWATPTEQGRNKQTNRVIVFDGRAMCVAAWADEFRITYAQMYMRLKNGWTMESIRNSALQIKTKNARSS
jgi:hypothetical protein